MSHSTSQKKREEGKYRFLLRNLVRGGLILVLFILAFLLFRKYAGTDYQDWFRELNPFLVYSVFTISEVFFGIITPEIFMAWGLEQGDEYNYVTILVRLMLISYGAGYLNYWIGRLFRKFSLVRWFILKRMKKYTAYLNRFGGFLLIVASTTPLPFAAICLLVGTASFSHRKFLLYTLFRLARFSLYGYLIWQANGLS